MCVGVSVGVGVRVGVLVAEGTKVGVGVHVGAGTGVGVRVGSGVQVGTGVKVGTGVQVGTTVGVAVSVGTGVGVVVAVQPITRAMTNATAKTIGMIFGLKCMWQTLFTRRGKVGYADVHILPALCRDPLDSFLPVSDFPDRFSPSSRLSIPTRNGLPSYGKSR